MAELQEETDRIGPYYKKRFEALTETPEAGVKDSLFARMDMLEGKRPKTVYLHFNVFGMRIAASITMLIVSSLALVAIAAVTVIAVRNNTRTKETELKVLPEKEPVKQRKEIKIIKGNSSHEIQAPESPSELKQEMPSEQIPAEGSEEIHVTEPDGTLTDPEKQEEVQTKETDPKKLLKELEEDKDLFGK